MNTSHLSLKVFRGFTCGLSCLLLSSTSSFAAGQKEVSYTTVDTLDPMTDLQIAELCQSQTHTVQTQLTEISTRLTGSPNALQVIGYYGQEPASTGPVGQNQQIESYCYLTFNSNSPTVLFNSYSAVHYTHLSTSTWDTACEPVFDQLRADPNTLITNYIKNATLFQGRTCEVTTVQAVSQASSPSP